MTGEGDNQPGSLEIDQSEQDVKRVAGGAGLSLVGKVVGRGLSFVTDVILARTLGASLFGLFSIGWTVFRILQMIIPLGFPQGVVKFIPEYKKLGKPELIKGLLSGSFLISALSGCFFGIILFLISPWLSISIFHKPDLIGVFRLFSIFLPICAILPIASSATRSTLNMKYSVLLEDIGQPLVAIVLIVGAIFTVKLSVESAIFADTFSFLLTGILGLLIVKFLFSSLNSHVVRSDLSEIRSVLAFSIPTSLAGVFSVFVFWVDRLIIGSLLSSAENGVYQAISQLSMVFVILYAAFNAILGPMFADLYARKDRNRLEEIYRVGTKWNFYLGIVPFVIFLLQSPNLLSVVYGSEYISGWSALIILAAGQLINCGTGSVGVLLIMGGRQKSWFWLTSAALVVNTAICFALVPILGISGAAIGTSISVGGMNMAATIIGKTRAGLWPYDRRLYKGILAGFLAAFAGLLTLFFHISGLFSLLVCCIIVLLVFLLGLYFLGLDKEDKALFSLIISRLK